MDSEPDRNKDVKDMIFGPGEKRFRYCKHISKQRLPNLSSDLMKKGKHFILIRNPLNILPSFDKVVPPSFMELGVGELVSIYSELCQFGSPPPVIDADDLQCNPEGTIVKEKVHVEAIRFDNGLEVVVTGRSADDSEYKWTGFASSILSLRSANKA